MSVFQEVLAVEVTMRGVDRIQQGIDKVIEKLGATEDQVKQLESGFKYLAAAAVLAVSGIQQAMQQQDFEAMVGGLTGSTAAALELADVADRIASRGVFTEESTFRAIENMTRFGASVEKNIDLVEKLGARSRNLEGAAELIGMIEAGYTKGLTRRLKAFGIGPEKLRGAGLQVDGMEIKGSSAQIIEALKVIEKTDTTLSRLEGTAGAALRRLTYQAGEFVETFGAPLLGSLTAVLGCLTDIFAWIKDLNIATDGWIGKLAMGGMLFVGLVKIIGFLKQIHALEKLIAIAAGVRSLLQAGPALVQGFLKVVGFLRTMLTIEKLMVVVETIRAFLAAAIAAAMGNIPGALMAIALIAAAGVAGYAAYHAVNNLRESRRGNGGGGDTPAERPVRRDDIERIYQKMYGNAFSG